MIIGSATIHIKQYGIIIFELPTQYDIPNRMIPLGTIKAKQNSQRHFDDAQTLASAKRFTSAIPIIVLSAEELGKAVWLTSKFLEGNDIPHNIGKPIFTDHREKLREYNNYLTSIGGSRTPDPFSNLFTQIQNVWDEQTFKLRLLHVDWNQEWFDPLYIYEFTVDSIKDSELFLEQTFESLKDDLSFSLSEFCKSTEY